MNDYEKAKDIEELASTVSNEAGSLFTDAGWAMPYYQGGYVYANRQQYEGASGSNIGDIRIAIETIPCADYTFVA